jgi:LuxR family maltose regulon positive regulatory protein
MTPSGEPARGCDLRGATDRARRPGADPRQAEPTSAGQGSHTFHPLFRTFLLERGRDALSPARRREIQTGAARLLAAAGDAEAAVDLLRGAGASAELGRLVAERAPELLRAGRWRTLGDWIRLVPAPLREGQPWLEYWLAQSRLPVAPREARACLELAFRRFLEQGDAAGAYLAWSSATQSYIYEWDDFAPLDGWIEAFQALRRRWPAAPDPEIEAAAVGGMFTALTYRQPGHPEIEAWRERARAVALGNADARLRRAVAFTLSQFECARMDFAEARAFVDALAPPPDAAASDPASVVQSCAARGSFAAFWDQHAEALRATREGLKLARAVGLRFWEPVLHLGAVTSYLGLDDVENARASLRAMGESVDRALHGMEGCYEHMACMVALRAGDPRGALRHAERALELARACGAPFWEGMAEVGLAVVRLATGDRRDAEAYARTGPPSHPPGWTLGRSHASAASAAAALRRGDEDLAAELLAAPFPAEGRQRAQLHLHLWVDRTQAAELCALALERDIGSEAARSIIRSQRLVPPERAGPRWPWPVRVFTLGRFEVELGGEPLRFRGKARRKPLELLQALVALGAEGVAEGDLVEALWPDAEADAGHHSLETTTYRLRRLLALPEVVQQRDRRLSLDRHRCWVDVDALQKLLRRASALSGGPARSADGVQALAEEGLALYGGPFLPGRDEHPWVLACRERTRRAMRRLVALGAVALDRAGRRAAARELERRASEADPALLRAPRIASA